MDEISELLSEIGKSVYRAKKRVKITEDFLKQLDETQEKLLSVLEKLDSALTELESDITIRTSVMMAFDLIRDQKNLVLTENISKAILFSSEFNHPVFAANLLKASKDPEAITTYLEYSGLDSKISVENNLDSVAGSLEDWGRAVLEVREAQGGSKTTPERASQSWAVMFNNKNSSPWIGIEQRRISFSGKLAPYWEILDKGHANISLISDRGGYPTPTESPTHFVDDTIKELEKLFNNEMSSVRKTIDKAASKIGKQVDKANKLSEKIQELITYSEENSGDIVGEVSDSAEETDIVNKVVERLSLIKGSIDREKLTTVVSEILETGTVSSYKITSEGRIEVTASGSTTRTRVSINTLLQMIAEG